MVLVCYLLKCATVNGLGLRAAAKPVDKKCLNKYDFWIVRILSNFLISLIQESNMTSALVKQSTYDKLDICSMFAYEANAHANRKMISTCVLVGNSMAALLLDMVVEMT